MNNQPQTAQKQPQPIQKQAYTAPVLEQQPCYVALTGVSLPFGTNIQGGDDQ